MPILDFFGDKTVPYVDPEDAELQGMEVLATITPCQSHEDSRRLCTLTVSESGYPVSVDSGTRIESCDDADSLQGSLAAILERPTTGRTLRALIERQEARSPSEGETSGPL